jgi:hypothetical protein
MGEVLLHTIPPLLNLLLRKDLQEAWKNCFPNLNIQEGCVEAVMWYITEVFLQRVGSEQSTQLVPKIHLVLPRIHCKDPLSLGSSQAMTHWVF